MRGDIETASRVRKALSTSKRKIESDILKDMKPKNPAAVALGRKGGKKTAKRGKEYYAEIAKKSHAARRKNIKASNSQAPKK